MSRQSVLLLFGGESSEHDVSIMSARNVYAAIDNEKYDVKLTYIDRAGTWWLLKTWSDDLNLHGGKQLAAVTGKSAFITMPDNELIYTDILFPVLHGENGHEDGSIQALAQLLHIKVIGCDLPSSVRCWDKLLTKQFLSQNDINVTPYEVYRAGDKLPDYQMLANIFGPEMFVKPTIAGSSVGVSKVHNEGELEPALNSALQHSDCVLIEMPVTGRELEIAVLGNPPHHQLSGIGEIIPGEEFYSYKDKYSPDSTAQVITKAEVPQILADEIHRIAHTTYQMLGCKGLARIDFLVSPDGKVYVNELNTFPGFTNISQYPKLWQEAGTSYADLVDAIIQLGLE